MSFASNLTTLRAVVSQLSAFEKIVGENQLSLEEYFTYLPLFEKIGKLAKVLDKGLVLEITEDEEGNAQTVRYFFEAPDYKRIRARLDGQGQEGAVGVGESSGSLVDYHQRKHAEQVRKSLATPKNPSYAAKRHANPLLPLESFLEMEWDEVPYSFRDELERAHRDGE